jgi:hypothetical protein
VPVIGESVHGAVLAHRRNGDAVAQGQAFESEGVKSADMRSIGGANGMSRQSCSSRMQKFDSAYRLSLLVFSIKASEIQ